MLHCLRTNHELTGPRTPREKEGKVNGKKERAELVGCEHITPADGNVFEDIGFGAEEAASLLEESKRRMLERTLTSSRSTRRKAPLLSVDVEMMSVEDIGRFLGVSRSLAYQVVRRDDFPPPLRVSARVRRWPRQAVLQWAGVSNAL